MGTQQVWAQLSALTLALASVNASATPGLTVLELFTSEGCSSCPPAERYLGELSEQSDVLALSFHVGYWDNLGWKDPFAFPATTDRQSAYARRFQLGSVYTPQLVVNGASEFVGSDRRHIGATVGAGAQSVPVSITHDSEALRISIETNPAASSAPAVSDVVLVPFRRRVTSRIERGENAGRQLEEYNVARELRLLGHYGAAAAEFSVPLASLPRDATDVAVLVQQQAQGRILGAASLPLER